ncbi:MAG: ABC transporter substrate-binding protein [Acidimicrobiia bacterium]
MRGHIGAQSGEAFRMMALYDVLLYEETNGDVTMRTAESLESDDGLVWTLKIRDDITFTDGTPYDAEAVKFNWERIKDPATKSPQLSSAATIASMRVVDPLTLEITLTEVTGQFPRVVSRSLSAIGSPKAIQEKGERFGLEPVGAGPFVLKSFVENSETVLERNPDYWDAPRPYLDELVLRYIGDDQQRTNALLGGDLDLIHLTGLGPAKQLVDAGWEHTKDMINGGRILVLNTTKPPFDDVRARQAVAYAIDWDDYNNVVEFGLGVPADTLFTEQSPFYEKDTKLPMGDPERAQELFDELAEENGGPLEFSLLAGEAVVGVGEYFITHFAKFDNVKVTVEPSAAAAVTPRVLEKDYEAVVHHVTQFLDPEPEMFNQFHSESTRNFSGIESTELDAALEKGRVSLDEDERAEAYADAQRILAEEVPLAFYARWQTFNFYADDVKGVGTVNDGMPLLWDIWIDG